MPLNASAPTSFHLLQNLGLIFLSLTFTPLITLITILSTLLSRFHPTTRHISQTLQKKCRGSPTNPFEPRTILVTGLAMSKGLTIARAFYRAGHTVIGADFEPYSIPVAGRFSSSLRKFRRLSKPRPGKDGAAAYIQSLLRIVQTEDVDLWISCSGVGSAIEDGEAKEVIERVTGCKAVQFNVDITSKLHEKDSFIECTRGLGLNVPETHPIRSVESALEILYPPTSTSQPPLSPAPCPEKKEDAAPNQKQTQTQKQPQTQNPKSYILKFTSTSDALRTTTSTPLLPLPTPRETTTYLTQLTPSPNRPFILQHFIPGHHEYCTHSLALHGCIVLFTACASSDLLMHYRPLPPSSHLCRAFLRYTELYAAKMGKEFTGHFSMDFLVDESVSGLHKSNKSGSGLQRKGEEEEEKEEGEKTIEQLMSSIYPIECNPRAHTAAVLFALRSEQVAAAYLSLLDEAHHESDAEKTKTKTKTKREREEIVMPGPETPGYYWVGHDLVTRVLLPVLYLLAGKIGVAELVAGWGEFRDHVLYWKDGTYEIWDPWPFWWLYVVYWPGMFWVSIFTRNWWSRCNVSTTKLFRCS